MSLAEAVALAHQDGLGTESGSLSADERAARSAYTSRWQALQYKADQAQPAPEPPRPQTVDDPDAQGFWWGPVGRRYYPREYEERYLRDPYYWRPWYYHNPVPHYYRYGPRGSHIGTGVYFHLVH